MYEIPQIIGNPKEGLEFSNRRITARYHNRGISLKVENEKTNFIELSELRSQNQIVSILEEKLLSQKGYTFANVGVSATITTEYKGKNFLITSISDRVDRKDPDKVIKLLSGYVEAENVFNPERQILTEIAEEFLPISCGWTIQGKGKMSQIHSPYQKERIDNQKKSLNYLDTPRFVLRKYNPFELPGMKRGKIFLHNNRENITLDKKKVRFHAAADTNSGQLIFSYKLLLPQDIEKLTLSHSEDRLRPGTTILDTHVKKGGIALLELDDSFTKLTGNVYSLIEGELISVEGDLSLSEAFAPKQNGISSVGKISLEEFLEIQNP